VKGQALKRLKDKRTKGQTVIYKTLHLKLRIYNGLEIHTSLFICFIAENFHSIHTNGVQFCIMWKYFCSLAILFVISTKCSAPWVLEFVVSSTIGDSQWDNCISLIFRLCVSHKIHEIHENKNPKINKDFTE
jgi:hypothetical protein